MNPLRPQTARAHRDLLRELIGLERSGQFDLALQELRGVWDNTTELPNVENLDAALAAETYLRCGALIGFLGHVRQIPTAQERSKNLLTEARSIFLEIYDPEKLAECGNYLALAYWRTGEINEARSWVEEAQSYEVPDQSLVSMYSFVIRDLILLSEKKFVEVCASFPTLEKLFDGKADNFLTGSIYNNFGIAAKNLGNTAAALDALEKARDCFVASGNKIQIALAENNLSQLYKSQHQYSFAHASIDRATQLFKEMKDRTREGFSLDTKALIYFDQGRFTEALETVELAIAILGRSENYAYLTETIATKAKIQLFASDFSTATLTLLEAVELAKIRISEDAAMRLIREFERSLQDKNAGTSAPDAESDRSGLATDDLKLVLPTSIAHYEDYQGIWISNSDLEQYGLARGSLAIVVPDKVRRGDLVALIELSSDLVSCGLYDSDFGIVCLEAFGSEPQLFDESEVKILGKIVGVCKPDKNPDGTLEVLALDL
ncbi:MAG TPA: tetratricopeptide repeat protein [Pyrinomonadaceae bacterium]|nr:tetratricopeptide repeat protein [Pyrinomonadaceae bacterium]